MAITPQEIKTLTEEELQWIKSQIEKIDLDIFARYDGSNSLEIVLEYEGDHRAFVNQAFFRRVVTDYTRCGWLVGDSGSEGNNRILELVDPEACAAFDVAELVEQIDDGQDAVDGDTSEETLETSADNGNADQERVEQSEKDAEDDLTWEKAVVGQVETENQTNEQGLVLEGEPGQEEEVETLWTVEDNRSEEIENLEEPSAEVPDSSEEHQIQPSAGDALL